MAQIAPITVTLEMSSEAKATLESLKSFAAEGIVASAVEEALREVINDLDYDLHKNIECDEETGNDSYPDITDNFIRAYKEALYA